MPPSILKVALPSPLRSLFDYLPLKNQGLSEAEAFMGNNEAVGTSNIVPGTRVLVSFGRRTLTGVVVAISDRSDFDIAKIKAVSKVIDDKPSLSPEILDLCVWAEKYYQHPIGEIVFYALPKRLRENQSLLHKDLTHWQVSKKGSLIAPDSLGRATNQIKALEFLQEHPNGLSQKALQNLSISTQTLNALLKKNLLETVEPGSEETNTKVGSDENILRNSHLTLNDEQRTALDQINDCLQPTPSFKTFLLNGVTASGKTEVYLQAIEECLNQGLQALVLVPEIGLTPQTVHRFRQRFNCEIANLHSGLSDLDRYKNWHNAKTGLARIVIGTRSSVFADIPDLGIIIVDEEHDTSYAQQEGFRFSARDIAIVRANKKNIPIVLGSATPSFESLHNSELNRYQRLDLNQRANNSADTKIRFIDTRDEILNSGLSQKVIQTIRKHLNDQKQILVFINRRGYTPVLICNSCNWIATCPYCDAKFTYHKSKNQLICHHCNYKQSAMEFCAKCHTGEMHKIGQGTEKIEEILQLQFKKTNVIRIDRDSTVQKDAFESKLQTIHEGKPCILVGTQMLAKGHHFPKVSMVAVIDADGGFFSTDFRALEKMSQLIIQIAGRAGRETEKSEVLIQTEYPDHPMLQTLANEGYLAFAKQSFEERKLSNFPPFAYLAMLRSESPQLDTALAFLQEAKLVLEQTLMDSGLENSNLQDKLAIFGPAAAPMEKRAGRYRAQLLLQAKERNDLQKLLHISIKQISELKASKKVRWSIAVDPLELF